MNKEYKLFKQGIQAFNERRFYDAHEFWEEIWLDHKVEDAKFIQGLIQLSVSYFHLFNQNLNGARSMIKKCLGKLEGFDMSWGIDVNSLIIQVIDVQNYFNIIDNTSDITDKYILKLKVIHEQ